MVELIAARLVVPTWAPNWKSLRPEIVVTFEMSESFAPTTAWLTSKYPSDRSTAWARSSLKLTWLR